MNAHKSESPAATGLNADQITNTWILPLAPKIGKAVMPCVECCKPLAQIGGAA